MNQPYIPVAFRRIVSVHIVKNMVEPKNAGGWHVPLLLGIHGQPGEGKTFMCESTLQEMQVTPFLISGGELESAEAGEPAELLRNVYRKASKEVLEGNAMMAAVLINDFDTAVGDWGETVTTTSNRQQLFAELMHLADYPYVVQREQTIRIPLILTGNDFSTLHAPLVRPGRMKLFEWKPDYLDKLHIVNRILPDLSNEDLERLVDAFRSQPISFYSDIKTSLADEQLWTAIQEYGMPNVAAHIRNQGRFPKITIEYDYEGLKHVGERVLSNRILPNHLAKSQGE